MRDGQATHEPASIGHHLGMDTMLTPVAPLGVVEVAVRLATCPVSQADLALRYRWVAPERSGRRSYAGLPPREGERWLTSGSPAWTS